MKVLLIDDDTALLSVLTTALKSEGLEVVTAENGSSGFETAKTEQPDFILLDEMLPDTTGNELLVKLKEDPATSHLPVAMLSNFTDSTKMQTALQNGALDYLLKYQIAPQDLPAKIKNLLEEEKQKQALQHHENQNQNI